MNNSFAGACLKLACVMLAYVSHALEIVIDTGSDNPVKIAVVPFSVFDDRDDIAPIVAFDLVRSGQFAPLERDNMLSFPSEPREVFFRDWRVLDTDYVLIGSVSAEATGDMTVNYHLFDVTSEREVKTSRISAPRAKLRDIAHKVSDEVFEEITGIPGAFSTKIAYVLVEDVGTSYANFKLEVADSDGERVRTLFESPEPMLSPSWSPDGSRLAYVTFETGRPSIVIQEVVSGRRERLPAHRGLNGAPVFSPDGRTLALVLSRDGNPEIYTMDIATKTLSRVTRYRSAIDTEPTWTPDGRNLLFTSDRGGRPQIYQVDLETLIVDRITYHGDYNARARLLPDGRHLIYVHRDRGIFHIAWQDLESADGLPRVLTQTSLDESPSVAPNGAMLIYATQDRGRGILAVVSIDGQVKYKLPSSSGDVREPAWSPFLDMLSASRGT